MNKGLNNLTLPRAASASKNRGSLPPPAPPLVRRAVAPGEGETRDAQPRFALSHQTREIRVVPRLMRRFGKIPDHTGEGFAL
jgi:hypothetical protein